MRMDPDLSLAERGEIFAAARHAFSMYRWLVAPDGDQQEEIQRVTALIRPAVQKSTPLLGVAHAAYDWLAQGGRRAPMRAAMVRYWVEVGLLRIQVPLTGPRSLSGEFHFGSLHWIPSLLQDLAHEAEVWLALLCELDHVWRTARTFVATRRRNSRAALAIDCLAAAPLLSASRLASQLSMSSSNALILLQDLQKHGLVVEVSHRSKRRLFGLSGMDVMRDHIAPPRRPQPGRGRGRPRLNHPIASDAGGAAPLVEALLPRIDQPSFNFDYSDLEAAMAEVDRILSKTRSAIRTE